MRFAKCNFILKTERFYGQTRVTYNFKSFEPRHKILRQVMGMMETLQVSCDKSHHVNQALKIWSAHL